MNKDIKDKWVKYLRSGNFVQGFHSLKSKDKRCVLGVLCEVAVDNGVIGEVPYSPYLPNAVLVWAGMNNDQALGPELPTDGLTVDGVQGKEYLVNLNDVHKIPFWQLANMIEAFA